MTDIHIKQMPVFKKAYKKFRIKERIQVDRAVRDITEHPELGREKKGDLSGIFVYKFKIDKREILLAYEWSRYERLLLALGTHENFYRDLKKRVSHRHI